MFWLVIASVIYVPQTHSEFVTIHLYSPSHSYRKIDYETQDTELMTNTPYPTLEG